VPKAYVTLAQLFTPRVSFGLKVCAHYDTSCHVLTKTCAVVAAIWATGCATAERSTGNNPDAARGIDADVRSVDAPSTPAPDAAVPVDAPLAPPAPKKLIITEVVLAPTAGEYIEIANPNTTAVALDNYYLTDSQKYGTLPAAAPSVDPADMVIRFPVGATLAPGAVATVAFDTATNFQITYGVAPTYSIAGGTMRIIAQNGTASLTNAGEMVALLWWDGASDLVKDCDSLNVGVPTSGNLLPNKTGLAVDGPDGGAVTSTYAADAMSMVNMTSAPGNLLSIKRLKLDVGYQTANATGNGITGDDETTEMLAQTWSTTFTAPTPGALPFTLP
jgi:hypothetical protein